MPLNRFNRTSWMVVVTPTDRPKSVHNRCVIGVLSGVFVLSVGHLIFCWYKGFVIGLSQISFLFSSDTCMGICWQISHLKQNAKSNLNQLNIVWLAGF